MNEYKALWEDSDGKTKVQSESMSNCLFVHHKPHIDWPGIGPRAFIVRGP